MQLIPKTLISNFGGAHFRNARSVMFHPQECEALEALAKVMSTGYVCTSLWILFEISFLIYCFVRPDAFISRGWPIRKLVRSRC